MKAKGIVSVLLLGWISLSSPTSVNAAEVFFGRVIGVSDGDTITVLVNGQPRKVRLNGIDCPEKTQAFGQKAKEYTAAQAYSKDVKVMSTGQDRYKRALGEVYLPDGRNLNEMLLAGGYAWWYKKYSRDVQKKQLEEQARRGKLGLWSDSESFAPWDYRKQH